MRPRHDFVDQSPHTLRLTLVEKELDSTQFTVLLSNTRSIEGLWVNAMVIGASHVIRVHTPHLDFNEVFACVGVPGYDSCGVNELVDSPVQLRLPGLLYEFSARLIPWQDPEPAELVEIVALARELQSAQIGLVYEFDRGPFSVDPKTVIVVNNGNDGKVVVTTAHSYPTSGLVLSRSIFTRT